MHGKPKMPVAVPPETNCLSQGEICLKKKTESLVKYVSVQRPCLFVHFPTRLWQVDRSCRIVEQRLEIPTRWVGARRERERRRKGVRGTDKTEKGKSGEECAWGGYKHEIRESEGKSGSTHTERESNLPSPSVCLSTSTLSLSLLLPSPSNNLDN